MMQAFRNAAKPVVLLITITFMAWLVLDLSGLSGGGGVLSQNSVGSINGTTVDARQYQEAVQNAITQRQQETGRTLGLEEIQQVRNEVWEGFIQGEILRKEIEARGIGVSSDEVVDLIANVPLPQARTAPAFQTDGQFDLSKYQAWLGTLEGQQSVPYLENQYRDEILRAKLLRNITADIFLSDAALWERYKDRNETSSIALTAIIGRNIIPDSVVTVTDAEVEAYYKANPAEFDRARTAFLSFLAVDRRLNASDSAAAVNRVQELRQEVIAGAAFEEVARRESADQVSGAAGGSLGVFGRGEMIPEFETAAFDLPLNTLSGPVRSSEGYHLIEVTNRWGNDSIAARHILVRIELAGAHRDVVDAQADTLENLAADRLDPSALDTAARALKLPVGQTAPVQEGNRAMVGSLLVGDAGVWAFQAKVGETSPVIETDEAIMVFRLDSLHEAGIPPLETIRPAARRLVLEARKDSLARGVATDLITRVKSGTSLEDASRELGLAHRTFTPFTRVTPELPNPKLVGAAFGLPVGAMSPVINTDEGSYVIRVIERVPADSTEFVRTIDLIRSQEIRGLREERVRLFMASIRAAAKVKDNRAELFRTNAQAEAEAPPVVPIQ
jgi:peptidyl-prolyl cis-trans isomerase D